MGGTVFEQLTLLWCPQSVAFVLTAIRHLLHWGSANLFGRDRVACGPQFFVTAALLFHLHTKADTDICKQMSIAVFQ